MNPDGEVVSSTTFNLNYLPTSGTLMFICGFLTMLALRIKPSTALRVLGVHAAPARAGDRDRHGGARARLRDEPLGPDRHARPVAGRRRRLLRLPVSPIVGWLGVAVTGSDTSSNALFGALQVAAAKDAGIVADAAGRRELLRRRARAR